MAASKPARSTLKAAGAQGVLGQVVGEAEGVVELERGLAGQGAALGHFRGRLVEQLEPVGQCLAEPGLLLQQGRLDQRLGADQLGIGAPISATSSGTSRCISGSLAPSRCAWRMARRMMRRRT